MPNKHTKVATTIPTVVSAVSKFKKDALLLVVVAVVGERAEAVVLDVGSIMILGEVETLGTLGFGIRVDIFVVVAALMLVLVLVIVLLLLLLLLVVVVKVVVAKIFLNSFGTL